MQLQRQKSQRTTVAASHHLLCHCCCLPSHSSAVSIKTNTNSQTFLVVSLIVPGQALLLQATYLCIHMYINIDLNIEKHSWELLNRRNTTFAMHNCIAQLAGCVSQSALLNEEDK